MKIVVWVTCLVISLFTCVGVGLVLLGASGPTISIAQLFSIFTFSLLSAISSGLALGEKL